MTTPEPSAAELDALDRRHLVRSIHRGHISERVVIVRGEGARVWDANGREMLDAAGGGVWHSPLGHGRADLAEVARAQSARLEFFTSLLEFTNDKAIRLAARLAELAPEGIDRAFFCGSGSEAVDTAIKAARLYHHRRGEPNRTWILSRWGAFHGAGYGSGTLTGMPPMQDGVGPNLPHVARVSAPNLFRAQELYGDEDPTRFLLRELEATIAEIGPENIAAMVAEPVIAAGGILVPPEDYWPEVTALLRHHGILLVADEVVTALGRTGAWFDSPGRGMQPDMITMAKGIAGGYAPLGATLMSDEIAETLVGGDQMFFHGYTFQGHPVACALGLATIDVIEREHLLDKADPIGRWLRTALEPAAELPVVGDIRGAGSMVAVELVTDRETMTPLSHAAAEGVAFEVRTRHGVIARPYAHLVVFAPPLVFEEHEAKQAGGAVAEVLSRLQSDGTIRPA